MFNESSGTSYLAEGVLRNAKGKVLAGSDQQQGFPNGIQASCS
jgi:hypothetical protein